MPYWGFTIPPESKHNHRCWLRGGQKVVGRSEQEQGGEGQQEKRDGDFLELWQQTQQWHEWIADTLVRLQDYERLFRPLTPELAVSASLKPHI